MIVDDANWTAILVGALTGGTAFGVAWLGYLGTKVSAATTTRQIAAETERQRELRREAEVDERRRLYHRFHNEERALFPQLEAAEEGQQILPGWFNSLYDSVNGIILLAPEPVARQANMLHRVLRQIRAHSDVFDPADPESLATFERLMEEWSAERRVLIDEMRRDVAPDTTAIEWPPAVDRSERD